MDAKPFSPAAERNREPILKYLQPWLADKKTVLEVGSGTAQHALHFSANMPQLTWQCSELPVNLDTLKRGIGPSHEYLPLPISLDVNDYDWAQKQYDVIYTANTLHIMHWQSVEHFLTYVSQALPSSGLLIIYGPFRYEGKFTSESNAKFDSDYLKARDPLSGIRDFEAVNEILATHQIELINDIAMPANNQLLCFQKRDN